MEVTVGWTNITLVVMNLALVIATGVYVYLTYWILRSQTDPCVIAYTKPNSACDQILDIVIENIGKGIARDVRFGPSRGEEQKWERFKNGVTCTEGFSRSAIVNGVSVLQPGGKIVVRWNRFDSISLEYFKGDGLQIECRCKRHQWGWGPKEIYPVPSTLFVAPHGNQEMIQSDGQS